MSGTEAFLVHGAFTAKMGAILGKQDKWSPIGNRISESPVNLDFFFSKIGARPFRTSGAQVYSQGFGEGACGTGEHTQGLMYAGQVLLYHLSYLPSLRYFHFI